MTMHHTHNRSDLAAIATQAMSERGLQPEFPTAALRQMEDITGPGLESGPDIRDLAGTPLHHHGHGVNGEVPGDRYTASGTLAGGPLTIYSPDAPKAIPDLATVTSTLTVNQDVTIGVLSAKLSISHTFDGDLKVTLTSPWGASAVLVNRRGGNGHDFYTVFDDRSSTPIKNGLAPFVGWYKPEAALSVFAGHNARGTWTLTVADQVANDVGKLNSWSITVEPTAGAAGAKSVGDENLPIWLGETNGNSRSGWVGESPRVPVAHPTGLAVVPEWLG